MQDANVHLTGDEQQEILKLHVTVSEYVELVSSGIEDRNPDIISKVNSQGEAISRQLRDLRNGHIALLTEKRIDPLVSSSYSDMLNAYRRVKDHTLNIAEAFAGEK